MRYWTVEEARSYLPRLRQLVAVVQEAALQAAVARSNGHARRDPDRAAPDPRAAWAELEAGDIIVRDPATGLVDFHALGADGVVYYLCYRTDEDDLGWWHLPEDGFAGRQPLPRDVP